MRLPGRAKTLIICRALLAAMIIAVPYLTGEAGSSALTVPETIIFRDVQGHWASSAIARWADLGVIHGDSRGFRPDDPITMAEMSVLLDNLLGFAALSGKSPLGEGIGPWYERVITGAGLAGLLGADGLGLIAPQDPLTWEQAAAMLAGALGVEENAGNETSIEDAGQIEGGYQLQVFGMEADGYLADTGESLFAPKMPATRAQVIAIIDRAVRALYSVSGTYSGKVKPADGLADGVTIVRADGIRLKGMKIDGSLIVAEGLTGGKFTLDNSVVSGNLVIRSGAGTTIDIINGSKVRGRAIVQGISGAVQMFSEGEGPLSVDVKSEAVLLGSYAAACAEEGSYLELVGKAADVIVTGKAMVLIGKDAEVSTIMLYGRAAGSIIKVYGNVASICTEAPSVKISACAGSKIAIIETRAEAAGTDIFLNRRAEVGRIDNAASITVSGSGSPVLIEGGGVVTFTYSVTYENPLYGFSFNLPGSWEGYSIVLGEWQGTYMAGPDVNGPVSGPIVSIRHPKWAEERPRQDIPIMIFSMADWDALQKEQFHIGAAPIGPSELGRSFEFVFALPARYNYAFPEGYEEVEMILRGNPLAAIR